MFNKETGKKHFLNFHGNSCKEGKNASSVLRILKIWTSTEEIELTGWVVSYKKVVTSNNFEKKYSKVIKHLYLNFLTTFHKTFRFHDYLSQFYSYKELVELQGYLCMYICICMCVSIYLDSHCLLLIIRIAEGLETMFSWPWGHMYPKFTFFKGNVYYHILELIILHEDMNCVILVIFLVQNLIPLINLIFIWLRWIWNWTFRLGFENLKKYSEYDKIQNMR